MDIPWEDCTFLKGNGGSVDLEARRNKKDLEERGKGYIIWDRKRKDITERQWKSEEIDDTKKAVPSRHSKMGVHIGL